MIDQALKNCISKIKAGEICREAAAISLLDIYYRECIDTSANPNDPYPEELTIPLKERNYGIYEALSWILTEQCDFNAEYEGYSPLMQAVGYADAPMTSFLIQNGADANIWPDMGEFPELPEENYYLVDIDVQYLNECWPRTEIYIKALLETAKVLLKEGGTGSFSGWSSFTADAENHLITLAEYKCEY